MITLLITSLNVQAQNEMSKMDTLSYSVGLLMAKNLKSQGFDKLDANSMAAGINDMLADADFKVSLADAQNLVNDYAMKASAEKSSKAKAEGEKFLKENAMKEGITVTESGLQYEVINAGSGKTPSASDKVNVHYHGTLIDGTVFDSSVDRGEPISFPVNGVILGWQEALQLMKEGDKWKIYIPSNLAYGERGAGAKIPPHSALVFEVELLSVEQ